MIWINNTDKNAIEVDTLIRKRRDSTEDKAITPDMAVEFLGMTNHFANIKFLIQQIKKNIKSDDDVAMYKNFILGAIDGREVSDETYKMLEDIAARGGFKEEFDEVDNKDKIYKNDVCKSVVVKDVAKFKECMEEGIPAIGDFREVVSKIYLNGVDFTNCQGLIFSRYSHIEMCNTRGLQVGVDIPYFCVINLNRSDLGRVKKLKVSVGCKLDLTNVKKLPRSIDVSEATEARFSNSDLSNVKELNIGNCKDISFAYATGLPAVIDVSSCQETNFHMADASNVKRIVFKTKKEAEHFCCWSKNFNGTAVYLDGGNFEHEYSLPKSRNYGMGL